MNFNYVFSIDDNFSTVFLVSVKSLIMTNYSTNLSIHILYTNLSNDNMRIISDFLMKEKVKFHFYNITDSLENISNKIATLNNSLSTYARLFISKILIHEKKAIYLDSDSIINGDLNSLFLMDLSNYYVAGVIDPVSSDDRIAVGLDKYENYINAGFLILNLELMREDGIEDKFINFIREKNGCVVFHDQGTINAVCRGKILYLEHKYNVTSQFYVGDIRSLTKRKIFNFTYKLEEIKYAQDNAVFIHFTGAFYARPWETKCKHPRKKIFQQYAQILNIPLEEKQYSFGYKFMAFIFYNTNFEVYNCVNHIVNKIRSIKI